MSIDKEKLEKDKAQMNELFEAGRDGKADTKVISQLRKQFFEIKQVYAELIDSQPGPAARYEYIEFCLDYVGSYIINKEGSAYISPEHDIFSSCFDTACNDSFPLELEEKILMAIQSKRLDNIYSIQLLARKLKDEKLYDRAINYYQVMQDRLGDPDEWVRWGECYGAQAKYAVAADTMKNGMRCCPDSQSLIYNYAYYHYRDGQKNKALEVLNAFIKRVETKKYADDRLYVLAVDFKAIIYRECKMALNELIEYSRLTATGGWNREVVMKEAEKIRPIVEAMNNG